MRNRLEVLAVIMLLMLGGGCVTPKLPELPVGAKEISATEVFLKNETTIQLEASSLNPLENLKTRATRTVSLNTWEVGGMVDLHWSETFERETAESMAVRKEAERATGVGEEPQIPEPVYETVTRTGHIKTDALDDGDRILLPAEWPEVNMDLTGSRQTVIWLSKSQYEELMQTRHTHLSVGVFDVGLQTVLDTADTIKGLVARISGSDTEPSSSRDITEIEADPEWGSYTFLWQNEKVKVPTIEAENSFARYTVLANPDNPLILEVELKPWAYGPEAVGLLRNSPNLTGYRITDIHSP